MRVTRLSRGHFGNNTNTQVLEKPRECDVRREGDREGTREASLAARLARQNGGLLHQIQQVRRDGCRDALDRDVFGKTQNTGPCDGENNSRRSRRGGTSNNRDTCRVTRSDHFTSVLRTNLLRTNRCPRLFASKLLKDRPQRTTLPKRKRSAKENRHFPRRGHGLGGEDVTFGERKEDRTTREHPSDN
ncbi:hypothetical protein Bbelb_104910 [Branchiostoma belcheri]|nr:hypothetical protein Bbelb_104910 [Branchiostoma belcheri]